jgi:hypothetical protein
MNDQVSGFTACPTDAGATQEPSCGLLATVIMLCDGNFTPESVSCCLGDTVRSSGEGTQNVNVQQLVGPANSLNQARTEDSPFCIILAAFEAMRAIGCW